MTHHAFSVVIPTYNRAGCVTEAIDSVLAQTHAAAEIIVVDDGSTDDTESILGRYGKKVRYTKKTNGGVSSARNHGITQARSEWIAFLDSDDLWHCDYLSAQNQSINRYPLALVHLTNLEIRQDDCSADDYFSKFGLNRHLGDKETDCIQRPLRHVLSNYLYSFPAAVIHTSLFSKFGCFHTGLENGEDLDCMARFAVQSSFAVTRRPLVTVMHRQGASLTANAKRAGVRNCRAYDSLFQTIENQPGTDANERAIVRKLRSWKKRQLGNLLLREGKNQEARLAFWQGFLLYPGPSSFLKFVTALFPPLARRLDRLGKDVLAG